MSQLLPIFEFTAEQTRKLAAEQTVAEAPIVIGDVTVVPISTLSCGFSCGGSVFYCKAVNFSYFNFALGNFVCKKIFHYS